MKDVTIDDKIYKKKDEDFFCRIVGEIYILTGHSKTEGYLIATGEEKKTAITKQDFIENYEPHSFQ